MKTYTASNELAEILKKNGFKEVTEKEYPEHYKLIQTKGYFPESSKRKFVFTLNSDYILFDYINIFYKFPHSKIELTATELKSIITYYKLPQKHRVTPDSDILNLHDYYATICKTNEWMKFEGDALIKQMYEAVVL